MEAEGVNTRVELAAAAAALRDRINEEHMLAGVTIVDPASTWIDADVEIEPDAVIHPFTVIARRKPRAAGAEVGPHVVVAGCGDRCRARSWVRSVTFARAPCSGRVPRRGPS